jgi:hypothetical protein
MHTICADLRFRGQRMFRRRETSSLFAAVVNTSRSAVVVVAALGGGMSLQGNAAAATVPRSLPVATFDRLPGDDQHNGNGKFNRVSSPFDSPNFNRGVQHVINANSGGVTAVQSSFCKKKVRCRFAQKVHVGGW